MWTCGRLRSIIDNSVLTYGLLTQIKSNLGLTVIKVGSKVGEHGLGSQSLLGKGESIPGLTSSAVALIGIVGSVKHWRGMCCNEVVLGEAN